MPDQQSERKMPNYGSDVILVGMKKGNKKGIKYSWIASANSAFPTVVFINNNNKWLRYRSKQLLDTLIHVFSHEIIHNIIWHFMNLEHAGDYDLLRMKFRKEIKKKYPKTWGEWTKYV